MPLRDTFKNAVLIVLSTCLTIGVCAVAVELFLDFRYEQWKAAFAKKGDWYGGLTVASTNPTLKWEYRPNAKSTEGAGTTIHTNRYGFRGVDYPTPEKPANTFRTAFVGDSVTLGLDVDEPNTFVRKFEAYANQISTGVERQALNFGIDGYNTVQIAELLSTKAIPFQPDEVLYVMCLNDFEMHHWAGDKGRYFEKPDSFLMELFYKAHWRLFAIDFHLWHFRKSHPTIFQQIIAMKNFLLEKDIPFKVAILPIFRFDESELNFSQYPLVDVHRRIGEFLTREGIEFLDLLDAFRNQPLAPNQLAKNVWHPNTDGHNIIAKQLVRAVRPSLETSRKLR